MEYMKVSEAAAKWGISVHRIQELCRNGRIPGAQRFGRDWMLPTTAERPMDARRKGVETLPKDPHLPMPRKSPYLHMTDLYDKPGEAEKCIEALKANPEAQLLLEAEIAYARGEIDKVYNNAKYFLHAHSGFYAIIGAGMLLARCAVWRGDLTMWDEAKRHICEAPCTQETDPAILSLAIASVDSSVYLSRDFPDWFVRGCFDPLPPDAHPAAKVYYVQYLYMAAYAVASKQFDMEGIQGLALMRMIPNTIEPMISQAVVDKTIVPEINLRLLCAVAYHNTGDDKHAIEHIDRAIALALPDRLYGLLAEHWRRLERLMEERLMAVDETAARRVKALYKESVLGWSRLSGIVRKRNIAVNLTVREREVAKLVSFGFSTKEVAKTLYIAEATVKQTVLKVMQKTGVNKRTDFSSIL
ncbi:MAG: helix-turn-helix domain-containing protein [Clostridia bacterium]|nr:helix-turn-helix domain-containing protein [Clostridia bacterium]